MKEIIKNNSHRNWAQAQIEIEERTLDNGAEVSQILLYFFDKHGMGDYEVLSSKKLPIEHPINQSLLKHYRDILNNQIL